MIISKNLNNKTFINWAKRRNIEIMLQDKELTLYFVESKDELIEDSHIQYIFEEDNYLLRYDYTYCVENLEDLPATISSMEKLKELIEYMSKEAK